MRLFSEKASKLSGTRAVLLLGLLNAVGQALVYTLKAELEALWIISIQSFIGFVTVWLISLFDGKHIELKEALKVSPSLWILLNLRALICGVGGLSLIYGSYQYLPLSMVSWLMAIPLATIWAMVLLRERISTREVIALIVSCIGLVVLSLDKNQENQEARLFGFLLAVTGILLFSLGWVLSKGLIKSFGERSFNILSNALFGFYSLVFALILFELPEFNSRSLLLLLVRGVLLGIVSMLFARSIRCLKITKGMIYMRLENVYTPLFGILIFGETLSGVAILGGMFLVGSALIAVKDKG